MTSTSRLCTSMTNLSSLPHSPPPSPFILSAVIGIKSRALHMLNKHNYLNLEFHLTSWFCITHYVSPIVLDLNPVTQVCMKLVIVLWVGYRYSPTHKAPKCTDRACFSCFTRAIRHQLCRDTSHYVCLFIYLFIAVLPCHPPYSQCSRLLPPCLLACAVCAGACWPHEHWFPP